MLSVQQQMVVARPVPGLRGPRGLACAQIA